MHQGGGCSEDSIQEDREPAAKLNTVETSPSQSLSDVNQNSCRHGEDTKDSSAFIRKNPEGSQSDWIDQLCDNQFFDDCKIHNVSKRERNYFCTSSCRPLCFTCLGEHEQSQSTIIQVWKKNDFPISLYIEELESWRWKRDFFSVVKQVRRYVYNDVLRVEDISRYINTSGIQNYTINGAKAVMLRKKLKSRTAKDNAHACQYCKRRYVWIFSLLSCVFGFRMHKDT